MITLNYKKWLFMSFILLAILYACTSEQDYQGDNHKKQIESLTVLSAKDYYNSVYGSTPRLKNSDDDQVSLTLDWDVAQLYTDSLWDVVESPIEFDNGIKMTLMTSDVSSRLGSEKVNEVKQVLRLVIVRNKETGKTVSFIMAILPGYDYMKQKGDAIYENKYLTRTSDLDGAVLFFGINGEFVNGWIYEDGEIIGYTLSRNSNLGGTKKQSTYCWEQITSVIDASGQEIEIGHNFYCEESGAGGGVDMSDRGGSLHDTLGNGGISNDYSDPPNGGGKDPSGQTPPDKKPETRTDCSGSATQNANNAQSAITGNASIISKTNTLRGYATQNISKEYGMLIDIRSGSYQAGNIIEGIDGYINFQYTPYTAYDVHTHDKTGGFSGHAGYTGFSVEDIYTTMQANKYYYIYYSGSASNPYKGSIVIAYDGSEYILSVNDARKAKDFLSNNPTKFEANDDNMFNDKGLSDEYKTIKNKLLTNNYSEQNAHDYALTYLLDKYDTGLKISKKESGKNSFKEMKTENINNNYQPKICP